MNYQVSKNAIVSNEASLGKNVTVWDYSQVRENVKIGHNSKIGSNVYIDSDVVIGENCKIQNSACLYNPSRLDDGVFIGPNVILTNDRNPRAVTPEGELKNALDWIKSGVIVKYGASIGAGAICIGPITIGSWSLVGAGSVVTKNVPDYALIVGSPAHQIGWVGEAGFKLEIRSKNILECPETGDKYRVSGQVLIKIKSSII